MAPRIAVKCYCKERYKVLIAYCTVMDTVNCIKTWQKKLEVANFILGNEELNMLNKQVKKPRMEGRNQEETYFLGRRVLV